MSLDQPPNTTENQVARHVLAELMRVHESHPAQAVAVADAFLEAVSPEWPDCAPLFAGIGAEAQWWADTAPDTAVSAMLVACLKRMALGRMVMPPNARKRALVAIWNTLEEKDRAAFLELVEPGASAKA